MYIWSLIWSASHLLIPETSLFLSLQLCTRAAGTANRLRGGFLGFLTLRGREEAESFLSCVLSLLDQQDARKIRQFYVTTLVVNHQTT